MLASIIIILLLAMIRCYDDVVSVQHDLCSLPLYLKHLFVSCSLTHSDLVGENFEEVSKQDWGCPSKSLITMPMNFELAILL